MHPSHSASSTSPTSTPISPIAETGLGRFRTARRADEAGVATPTGDLTAPMPGTVLKINMADGDSFEAHDSLIVMESMNMEMPHSSPQPGRVVEIRCQMHDLVKPGKRPARLARQPASSSRG